MDNYKMKNALVYRKWSRLENGEMKEGPSWELGYIDEVEHGSKLKCAFCNGKVAAHKGRKLAHHFEHTKGEGVDCPVHDNEYDEEKLVEASRAG